LNKSQYFAFRSIKGSDYFAPRWQCQIERSDDRIYRNDEKIGLISIAIHKKIGGLTIIDNQLYIASCLSTDILRVSHENQTSKNVAYLANINAGRSFIVW